MTGKTFVDYDFESVNSLEDMRSAVIVIYLSHPLILYTSLLDHIWKEIQIYHPTVTPYLPFRGSSG
jgi:hypothetical protein